MINIEVEIFLINELFHFLKFKPAKFSNAKKFQPAKCLPLK